MSQYVTKEALEKMVTLQKGYIDQKQDALTVGDGLNLTNNKLTITLDHTIYKVVEELPTAPAAGDENKIHLVKSTNTGTNDSYAEYIYVSSAWEKLGEFSPEVDLSPYLKSANLTATTSATSVSLTKNSVSLFSLAHSSDNFTGTKTGQAVTINLTSTLSAAMASGLYKVAINKYGRITAATKVITSDITGLGGIATSAQITALDGRVTVNEDDIKGLKESVATNATNIATNATDIDALEKSEAAHFNVLSQDIATNKTNIATNTTNIANLTTRVSALETSVAAITDFTADDAGNMYTSIYGIAYINNDSSAEAS